MERLLLLLAVIVAVGCDTGSSGQGEGQCSDQCVWNRTQCDGGDVLVCNDFSGDGCAEWGFQESCANGCANGACEGGGAPGTMTVQECLTSGECPSVAAIAEYLVANHANELRGPQGERGQPGTDGEDGQDGVPANSATAQEVAEYLVANYREDIEGPQGPRGETGLPGPQGPQGLQGVQGDSGPQGPRGTTGATGSQGPQGPQGLQGPPGPAGPAGTLDANMFYARSASTDPIPPGQDDGISADCDPGDIAISCQYETAGEGEVTVYQLESGLDSFCVCDCANHNASYSRDCTCIAICLRL
jgi:hypothetical protein